MATTRVVLKARKGEKKGERESEIQVDKGRKRDIYILR